MSPEIRTAYSQLRLLTYKQVEKLYSDECYKVDLIRVYSTGKVTPRLISLTSTVQMDRSQQFLNHIQFVSPDASVSSLDFCILNYKTHMFLGFEEGTDCDEWNRLSGCDVRKVVSDLTDKFEPEYSCGRVYYHGVAKPIVNHIVGILLLRVLQDQGFFQRYG